MSPKKQTPRERLESVKNAKKAFIEEYGRCDWFRGAGVTRVESDWCLRINVDPSARQTADLPEDYAGFPIQVVFIGSYRKRPTSLLVF